MSYAIETASPEIIEHLDEIVKATKSEATKKAYQGDVQRFLMWCEENEYTYVPASEETVGLYAVYLSNSGRAPSTISRSMTAINQWHSLQGWEKPANGERIREIRKGIRRISKHKVRKVDAITWPILHRMLGFVDGSAIGIRDKALLLLGFATAFRRSELVAINIEDIEFVDEGLVVTQTKSKTNQIGDVWKTAVPFIDSPGKCPVRAVRRLINYLQTDTGPLFYGYGSAGRRMLDVPKRKRMTPHYVARIVKKYAEFSGYDPSRFSGHSLRAGFVTSAAKAGISEARIMLHTGHRSHQVMIGYVREGRRFEDHPLNQIVISLEKETRSQGLLLEPPSQIHSEPEDSLSESVETSNSEPTD